MPHCIPCTHHDYPLHNHPLAQLLHGHALNRPKRQDPPLPPQSTPGEAVGLSLRQPEDHLLGPPGPHPGVSLHRLRHHPLLLLQGRGLLTARMHACRVWYPFLAPLMGQVVCLWTPPFSPALCCRPGQQQWLGPGSVASKGSHVSWPSLPCAGQDHCGVGPAARPAPQDS